MNEASRTLIKKGKFKEALKNLGKMRGNFRS